MEEKCREVEKDAKLLSLGRKILDKKLCSIDDQGEKDRMKARKKAWIACVNFSKPMLLSLCTLEKKVKEKIEAKFGKKTADLFAYSRIDRYTDEELQSFFLTDYDAAVKEVKADYAAQRLQAIELFDQFELNIVCGEGASALRAFSKSIKEI